MVDVRVYVDRPGNTLTVWFGNPATEVEAEETGDEIVLMKDSDGNVIGIEKLNVDWSDSESVRVSFETVI